MKKKLYKSNERKLSGVCGGFAEYLDLDPTIVRLAWTFFTLCSLGTGIIAYIIAAIVMSDKPEGDVVVITEDQNNE